MLPLRYVPKKISKLAKTDSRVAIVGRVIELGENSFVLDDDTGKIEIFFEGEVEKDKLVRAYCTLIGGQLKADVVQSLDVDLNLFKTVEQLYNKAGV